MTDSTDTGWHPGRWWRVVDATGNLWCETSNEDEARAALPEAPGGGELQRLWERRQDDWRPAS